MFDYYFSDKSVYKPFQIDYNVDFNSFCYKFYKKSLINNEYDSNFKENQMKNNNYF